MTACPTLETKRLILRPFREDDLNDYFTMMETPELRESLGIPPEEGKAEAVGTSLNRTLGIRR
jgi:RimJ/RimL family protein N-acetyltransferase